MQADVIDPKTAHPGADVVDSGGRQHRRTRKRERPKDLAGSGSEGMHTTNSARENREISWSPEEAGAGREGKAKAVIPR